MSADNYLKVDYDGEIFLIYEGFESNREDEGYEPELYDTAGSATVAEEIIEEYGFAEYGVEYTPAASRGIHDGPGRINIAEKAVEAAVEQLSELNIKVVNLANKLEEHLKEIDAHHPAMMGQK